MFDTTKQKIIAVAVAATLIGGYAVGFHYYKKAKREAQVEPPVVTQPVEPTPGPVLGATSGFPCKATVEEFKATVKNAVPEATFWEPNHALSEEVMRFYNSIPPASNVPSGIRIIIVPPNEKQPRPYLAIIDKCGEGEGVIINGFFGAQIWAEMQRRWPTA